MNAPTRIFATVGISAFGVIAATAVAAPWEFNPRVEAGYLYDDNYRLTAPGGEIDVSGPLVDAAVELRTITQTGEFSFTPRVRATYFPDAKELDAVDYFANLDWQRRGQRAFTRLRGEFSAQDIVNSEQPDVETGGELGEPDIGDSGRVLVDNRRTRWSLRPSMNVEVSQRREMQFDLGYTDVTFDENITDAQVDFSVADVAIGLLSRINERDSFTARLRGARYDIETSEPTNGYGAEVQWERRTVTDTRWYIRAGAQQLDFTLLDVDDNEISHKETVWLAGAGVNFMLGRDEMLLDLTHNVGPSSAGTVVARDQLRFRWTRALTPRLSLLAGLRGTHDEDLDDSPSSTFAERSYATGDIGLQWFWQEEFSLRVAYDYTWQKFRGEADPAKSSGALISVLYQPLQRRR
jgi:hypothetical protein